MILFISCSCFPIGNTPSSSTSSSTSSSSSSIPGPMSSIKKWSIGFVGVVGILLLLAGTLQMGGGVYFILTLPVFSVASNIWTGVVTGLTGTVLTYFGCIQQTTRRTYILLTFCVVTLVANVANIIITQVGNNTLKLSLTKISDTEDDQTRLLAIEIGFWLTTGSTAFAILSSFVLANYLFCGQIKGKVHKALNPLDKTGSKERLENHTINKKTRFFPPSRIINAKDHILPLPSIHDVMPLPDPSTTSIGSSWVYNADDKVSLGLYPLGLEVHPDIMEGNHHRPTPVRNSSFAAPKFARVQKRPQRAQTFVIRNDPFSLHGESRLVRSHPISVPQLPKPSSLSVKRVQRSTSLTSRPVPALGLATLSRKYQAFSMNKETDCSILEVGSLHSGHSEPSLINALTTDFPTELPKLIAIEEPLNKKVTQFGGSTSQIKVHKLKGPAPLPPIQKDTISTDQNEKVKLNSDLNIEKDGKASNISNSCNDSCSYSDSDSKTDSFNQSEEYDSHIVRANELYNKFTKEQKEKSPQKYLKPPGQELVKPPRLTKENIPIKMNNLSAVETKSNNINFTPSLLLRSVSEADKFSLSNLDETRMVRNTNLSQYKMEHKQAVEDAKNLLEILPSPEVQRNKIILRVPSFKNTGCQTESYRAIRRRASCSTGHATLTSRYFPSEEPRVSMDWRKTKIVEEPSMTNESSSGYSSPDGDSKDASPVQSGPPSPGSTYESGIEENKSGDSGTNITIIEINKDLACGSSRPQKPQRARPLSDASTLAHKVYGIPNDFLGRTLAANQHIYDSPSFQRRIENQPEHGMLLAEAINPALVRVHQRTLAIPRVVDAMPKPHRLPLARSESSITLAHKTKDTDHYNSSNQYSIPRPVTNQNTTREGIMNSATSTAAYLASLELLASHYRQQALANAKQLKMQQNVLEQQKKNQENNYGNQLFMITQANSSTSTDENETKYKKII